MCSIIKHNLIWANQTINLLLYEHDPSIRHLFKGSVDTLIVITSGFCISDDMDESLSALLEETLKNARPLPVNQHQPQDQTRDPLVDGSVDDSALSGRLGHVTTEPQSHVTRKTEGHVIKQPPCHVITEISSHLVEDHTNTVASGITCQSLQHGASPLMTDYTDCVTFESSDYSLQEIPDAMAHDNQNQIVVEHSHYIISDNMSAVSSQSFHPVIPQTVDSHLIDTSSHEGPSLHSEVQSKMHGFHASDIEVSIAQAMVTGLYTQGQGNAEAFADCSSHQGHIEASRSHSYIQGNEDACVIAQTTQPVMEDAISALLQTDINHGLNLGGEKEVPHSNISNTVTYAISTEASTITFSNSRETISMEHVFKSDSYQTKGAKSKSSKPYIKEESECNRPVKVKRRRRREKNPDPPPEAVLPPCNICGEKSSGYHYGTNTCEPCKVLVVDFYVIATCLSATVII